MRRPITFLSAFALLLGMLAIPASAEHDDPVFELDGNVDPDHPGNYDWTDFLEGPGDVQVQETLPAGFIAAGASADHALPDTTTFTQGSKDTLDISDWTCTRTNNVNNKVDITNAYSVAERNEDGHLIIYFGTEIRAPEGNSNIGMWFLQDEDAGCEQAGGGSTPFDGNHVVGDVLVVSAFTNGGTQANITVYKWVGSGGSDGALDLVGDFAAATCSGGELGSDTACAIANSEAVVPTPWFSPDRRGDNEPLAVNTFFEGAVNITELLGTEPADECFTQFLANTRSSQSLTATLFDYTTGELEICGGLTIVKETDPAGEDQDFDFTITGPGIDGTGTFELNAADHDEGEGNPASTTFSDLLIGDYTITEVDIPDGWDLTSIVCDDGTTGNLADGAVTVSVGVSTGVTCTFTNTLRHSILVEKTYAVDPGEDNLAEFTLHEDDAGELGDNVGDLEYTEADGRHFYCIDDLIPGDYWLVEESPTGFLSNDDVPVSTSSTETCDQRVDGEGLIAGADGPDETIDNEPAPVDLTVTKWKLTLDGEGELVRSTTPLAGFEYTLYLGEDDEGVFMATSTTGSDGETDFAAEILEVDETYTVCETGTPDDSDYWTGADCQTFKVALDTDVELHFENEPLSRVQVLFFNETGFTNATIDCGEGLGEELTGTDADEALELDHLPLGDHQCTISISNGGPGD